MLLCHFNVYNAHPKCEEISWQDVEVLQSPNNDMSSFPHEEIERKINKMNTDVMSDVDALIFCSFMHYFANYYCDMFEMINISKYLFNWQSYFCEGNRRKKRRERKKFIDFLFDKSIPTNSVAQIHPYQHQNFINFPQTPMVEFNFTEKNSQNDAKQCERNESG